MVNMLWTNWMLLSSKCDSRKVIKMWIMLQEVRKQKHMGQMQMQTEWEPW